MKRTASGFAWTAMGVVATLASSCVVGKFEIDQSNGATGGTGGFATGGSAGVQLGGSAGSNEGGGATECADHESRCYDSRHVQSCSDGRWAEPSECTYACIEGDGECGGECVPGRRACRADGVTPTECDGSGAWTNEEPCDGVCTNGQCAESCSDEARQCADGVLLVCEGGAWAMEEECAYVCDDSLEPPRCGGECRPEDTRCVSHNEMETCGAEGTWQAAVLCVDSACQGDPAGCEGDCSPGAQDCDGGIVLTCSDTGDYEPTANCAATGRVCEVDGATASCECPVIPQCDADNERSGSYCDGTTLVTCTEGDQSCQSVSTESCQSIATESCIGSHPNAMCEVAYGDGVNDGTEQNIPALFLYLRPLSVDANIEVNRIGFVGRSSGEVAFAIYADTGTSPGSLISGTTVAPAAEPRTEISLAGGLDLSAGDYWLGIVGEEPIYLQTSTAQGPPAYQDLSAGVWPATLPNDFTGTSSGIQSLVKLYVVGTPQ